MVIKTSRGGTLSILLAREPDGNVCAPDRVSLPAGLFRIEEDRRAAAGRPDPRRFRNKPNVPWPVRRGGWILKLYSNSPALAFLLMFLVSFILHAFAGTAAYNEEQLAHGGQAVSVLDYATSAQFWFESFQNWQSEFLAIAAMVVLSVFLRNAALRSPSRSMHATIRQDRNEGRPWNVDFRSSQHSSPLAAG